MPTTQVRAAEFGADKAGLSTVGYQLYLADGSASGSRVTAGITGRGGGVYRAAVIFPDAVVTAGGEIVWDTGEASPVIAGEAVLAGDFPATVVNASINASGPD